MKIGLSVDPFGSGYARFGENKFKTMAQHGFSAVDYKIANTDTPLYGMGRVELQQKMHQEKLSAQRAGIFISQVHGPWRYPPQDETVQNRQERMQKMQQSILATEQLGCKYWVIHPLMPFGMNDLGTENAPKTWEINLQFMTELLAFAKMHNVTICLENMPMPNFSMGAPSQILQFVQTINDDNFKICLDTGHTAVFPHLNVADEVRRLGKQIKVFHIHDNFGQFDEHMLPTKGKIDWDDFLLALKQIEFDGTFSLEIHFDNNLDCDQLEKQCSEACNIAKSLVQKLQNL